jgi:hypothetical protein
MYPSGIKHAGPETGPAAEPDKGRTATRTAAQHWISRFRA